MKSYSNIKLKKKLENKGIALDEKKKNKFDKYSYYQVINAYKNIFSTNIEDIDEIIDNINNNKEIDRYKKIFGVSNTIMTNSQLIRTIKLQICKKYGIQYKNSDTDEELLEKIKTIDYYNHIYSNKVMYSDFIRMYKFEHELRSVLLKYTLIIEESLKNVLVVYLNNIEAKDNFLTDINQYETSQGNIKNAVNSIKKIFDKQTNKNSNPIKRKINQNLSVPYWILINELTLGETINTITNLKEEHVRNILEKCINYFTNLKLDYSKITTSKQKQNYNDYLNAMREMLRIIGKFRNNLAHNQPIYNFNVKDCSSTKGSMVNYLLPKTKKANDTKGQYALNTKYMSYFANFWGSDKYNSFTGNSNINLSWIIYVILKFINHLDENSNFYDELVYVYKKYNIILKPANISVNETELYGNILKKIEELCKTDFGVNTIIKKYSNEVKIKKDLISLNAKLNNIKKYFCNQLNLNEKNNECLKYTHFLFDSAYKRYTGIDKKYFDKIMNIN